MSMTKHHLLGLGPKGFHKVAYTQWGDSHNPRVLICVHGLLRNGRDFDYLAGELQHDYRVLCVDMPGRGDSDWLENKADYDFPVYLNALTALVARSGADEVHWVGTSMGGILGMVLASQPGSPITRLVLNDVGGFIPRAGLARIRGCINAEPHFATLDEAYAHFRKAMASFGIAEDEYWHHVVAHGVRAAPDGGWSLHYDPGIALTFTRDPLTDIPLWALWDSIRCPVLVVRGEQSDILTAETVAEMQTRGPGCRELVVPGVGHAPMLFTADQVDPVADWLRQGLPQRQTAAPAAKPKRRSGWAALLERVFR